MRHRRKTQNLSRFSSYYKATIKSLAQAVIIHQKIITTKVRAKIARELVDNLITLGKQMDSIAARRRAFVSLGSHSLVAKLFKEIAPMFTEKHGGYTRIIPYKRRRGDNAELVVLELSVQKTIERPMKEKHAQKKEALDAPKTEAAHEKKDEKKIDKKPDASVLPEKEKHKKEPKQQFPKKPLGGFGKLFKSRRDSL